MTIFPFPATRVGIAFHARTLGLLTALAVAATGYLATPNPAAAAPVTYTLSDVTATFPSGTDQVTGSFTYDPSTGN